MDSAENYYSRITLSMSLKSARLTSLREKLEAKDLTVRVDEVVESVLEGEEPQPRKLKAKSLKDK